MGSHLDMYKRITENVINGIKPQQFVENVLQIDKDRLIIGNKVFKDIQNITVIGFGKATLGMYASIKQLLGGRITSTYLSVPYSTVNLDTSSTPQHVICKERVVRAAENNLPDENTLGITNEIVDHLDTLRQGDLCISLISGGGSALLCQPIIPLCDLLDTIRLLVSKSATIQQLNTVRTYLCAVKGGGLAAHIAPATVISLIVSDVVGDSLQFIASAPTFPVKVSANDVTQTMSDVNVSTDLLPLSVQELLLSKYVSNVQLELEPNNIIVASNSVVVEIAEKCVSSAGYTPVVISKCLTGEARVVAVELVESILFNDVKVCEHVDQKMKKKTRSAITSGRKKLCFIYGGETTVTLCGEGVGGRCQELALSAALCLGKYPSGIDCPKISLVVTSTDGQDGPNDASGAIVSADTLKEAELQGLDSQRFLLDNDSYNFFRILNGGENQLKSGLTGTNLMDVVLLFVDLP